MKDTIRWGIVGPGSIAHRFANAVKNVAGAEVTAVASRSEERAKEFAAKHDIPNAFGLPPPASKAELFSFLPDIRLVRLHDEIQSHGEVKFPPQFLSAYP